MIHGAYVFASICRNRKVAADHPLAFPRNDKTQTKSAFRASQLATETSAISKAPFRAPRPSSYVFDWRPAALSKYAFRASHPTRKVQVSASGSRIKKIKCTDHRYRSKREPADFVQICALFALSRRCWLSQAAPELNADPLFCVATIRLCISILRLEHLSPDIHNHNCAKAIFTSHRTVTVSRTPDPSISS